MGKKGKTSPPKAKPAGDAVAADGTPAPRGVASEAGAAAPRGVAPARAPEEPGSGSGEVFNLEHNKEMSDMYAKVRGHGVFSGIEAFSPMNAGSGDQDNCGTQAGRRKLDVRTIYIYIYIYIYNIY